LVEQVGQFRPKATGLRQHGSSDALGRAAQQVPYEGTTDAKAKQTV
jgi:hypothetical protein